MNNRALAAFFVALIAVGIGSVAFDAVSTRWQAGSVSSAFDAVVKRTLLDAADAVESGRIKTVQQLRDELAKGWQAGAVASAEELDKALADLIGDDIEAAPQALRLVAGVL